MDESTPNLTDIMIEAALLLIEKAGKKIKKLHRKMKNDEKK
jgi:hypothetical protein